MADKYLPRDPTCRNPGFLGVHNALARASQVWGNNPQGTWFLDPVLLLRHAEPNQFLGHLICLSEMQVRCRPKTDVFIESWSRCSVDRT